MCHIESTGPPFWWVIKASFSIAVGLNQSKPLICIPHSYTQTRHVDDVDLFVGGLLERPVRGGIVGETFGNIIANQFADIKFGDAYFFMREKSPKGFTDEQLKVIKSVTLRDLVCTCGGVSKAQVNVFFPPFRGNPLKPCWDTRAFNVKPWMKFI
ncbi:hypothetical protein PoB_001111600 [Plakobranchus ocellatus]|uniref:Uncharacterized protein n=1 Tax=Plakobranchus ocellatus TaxID=259542 RepID=A0AAV3YQC0_9GAST|nr:hypothetical protein PoB_001111600 [Plakobranchus ocellatus]